MKKPPNCPKCSSEFTYKDENLLICPECGHEWVESSESEDLEKEVVVKDAHGNILKDGDSVTIIKDIKVKGTSSAIKVGVKVKDIRLIEEVNGHNIDAKVKGFGAVLLKSEFVKKCN
ncbi:alkylphosphonate utilization protein [Candidatus Aerophobetes bacterium]|uniref:Alkylphosphonate utilization protein n=1 Tax=Aerophobetes bacterium TaxID=2030807 RepID=A0A2A4YK97_UNCAE|nr:MAG: alkylphosphonate utilization protein [Candidatus Aerophobetes bacterium]